LGNVTVGSTTLSPEPFYTQTGLGGGAVGLARFNYHPVDSGPDDDSTVSDPDSITAATAWYYGPLFISGSGDGPYKIESRVLKPPSQTWTDVSSDYTVTVVGDVSRQVRITRNSGAFPVNREYRFVPYQSGSVKLLKCAQVNGTPPVHDTSQDDHYSFSIPLGTIGTLDFSGDGKLDDTDMAHWLMQETDLDKDGKIDESDYIALQHAIDHGL
jgi:hypothetical protein